MFRRDVAGGWTILADGHPIPARDGDSVATALLAAGILVTRANPVSGAPRGQPITAGAYQ
jgi:hypothetical protein